MSDNNTALTCANIKADIENILANTEVCIPAWLQIKLAVAESVINSVKEYLKDEASEEESDAEEASDAEEETDIEDILDAPIEDTSEIDNSLLPPSMRYILNAAKEG